MRLENNLNDVKELSFITQLEDINSDIVKCICGKKIGQGQYRSVHEFNLDKDYVVKLEPLNTSCNTVEYMMWDEIKGLKEELAWVKDWFAPVKWISPNGRVLLMKKTEEEPDKKLPKKIPSFLWDVKPDNFGWLGKNYVCHDYGQFYNFIHYPKKFKKLKF